jgi:IS4 transposase
MKDKAQFEVVAPREVPQGRGILADQRIRLSGVDAQEKCPQSSRGIEAVRADTGDTPVLLTTHHQLGASTIAAIDKDRWQIERFFKALKHDPKIRTFVGTSANAVKTQVWCALISMVLLRYLQLRSRSAGRCQTWSRCCA